LTRLPSVSTYLLAFKHITEAPKIGADGLVACIKMMHLKLPKESHMKTLLRLTMAGVLGLAAACGGDDNLNDEKNIVETARDAGNFTTLVGALEATGLDETLAGEGPFTVFAPTDAAFALLPAGVLESLDVATLSTILTYHVAPGELLSPAVLAATSALTVQGEEFSIRVEGSTVVLDGSVQVTQVDIIASNGVIHVIDAVLLPDTVPFPGTLVDALSAKPIFSDLVGAVVTAELADDLIGDNNGEGFTVFTPTNFAFDRLGIDVGTLEPAALADILLYHVVSGTVDAATVVGLTSATALQGDVINIDATNGVVLNGTVTVTDTDLFTNNGVFHVLDNVLLPPN
jgi:transforming growth factor-beta-induced protein